MGNPPEVFLQYESGTVQAVPREKDLSQMNVKDEARPPGGR